MLDIQELSDKHKLLCSVVCFFGLVRIRFVLFLREQAFLPLVVVFRFVVSLFFVASEK